MKQLGDQKPAFSFGIRMPGKVGNGFAQVLAFRKHWTAIAVMAVFTGAFSIPLFTLPLRLGDNQDLFDLTSNLFTLFWAVGWSVGVLVMLLILLVLLFAREVLLVTPEGIRLRIEILCIGLEALYKREGISHLRFISDGSIAGATWRGNHLTFDYMQVPVSLGSCLDSHQAGRLCDNIIAGLGQAIPVRLPASTATRLERSQENLPPSPNKSSLEEGIQQPMTGDRDNPDNRASRYLLVAANLVPLAGVFLLDWRVADIMLLFWFESAIIGFFNILKMFRIAGITALFYSLFFIGHFGAFMAVHLMFIFALFIESNGQSTSLSEVAAIFVTLWPAIAALFISHAFSFRENFLKRREYERLTIKDQMSKPYTRIILMHVTIIVGGFLTMLLSAETPALVLLIMLKIIVDLKAHGREHHAGDAVPGKNPGHGLHGL